MQDLRTEVVLKLAQIINPQIRASEKFSLDIEFLRQLPAGTLGREVAQFLDQNGFDPLNSGDWIQRTHDIWHVLTGLSASEHDEFVLQAFVRSQVFRPSSAILVIAGLLTRKCNLKEVAQSIKTGRLAKHIVEWDIESDWETPLELVRQKLGIVPLTAYSMK
ncbi:Coq4 family protein [Trichocoleus desertorum AS-A10]|uniref:Coq4 family protein n=1 Tax=Trichocoleus desertorum TaxID=1481672 RepID=UPI003298FEDA